MRKNEKINPEELINKHFEEIASKDRVRNAELDAPPSVDLDITNKKEDEDIAEGC